MRELHVYQFEKHDLIQITDGREPHSLPADRAGWRLIKRFPATPNAIAELSAAPSEVLEQIDLQGYCSLAKGQIATAWRKANTVQGLRE